MVPCAIVSQSVERSNTTGENTVWWKNPRKAIEIAHVLLSYVKGNPGKLHYARKVKNLWGARGQLKIPRREKLIEVFADIAYSTGSGHIGTGGLPRAQGQVLRR